MTADSGGFRYRHRDGMLSAVAAGFFLILVGALFVTNPDLPNKLINFFNNFELQQISNSNVYLPAPKDPETFLLVYRTVEQFCLIWAVFLVAMLGARFILGSSARRKADGLGDIVFWFGAAYLVQTYLVQTWLLDVTKWFEFWALIIVLIGASMVVRGLSLVAAWQLRRKKN